MNGEQTSIVNPEVFKLVPADINHLFRRSGLNGNRLTPFRYNAEQAAVSTPSEAFKAISENPNFQMIARRLLEPDLKIEFNSGGGSAADDKYYAFLLWEEQSVLTQFINSKGDILLLLFPEWNAFLEWWAGIYASKGMDGYQTVFPNIMETEVLVCALNCIDIYRRSYMESMLDYRGGLNLALTTEDFVQLLKRSLASKDKRWLLPTLFEMTPGLKNSSIALKPEHIQQAEALGFLTSNEATLTLAERSRIMGTEFITSWMGAIGCQATALLNGEERSLSRVFIAITAFANHLFSFVTGANGDTRFRHQASTAPELINTLSKWLEALQQVTGNTEAGTKTDSPDKPHEPSNTVENNTLKAKFCGQCGAQIRPGKKFCASCGTAV
jgi:hypothetical protein